MATQPIERAPLRESLAIQIRILGALLIREMLTRYGRHNIGFLWLFVEPMLFTLGVTALWTATKSVHGSDLPIVAFALTGYSSVLLWRNMPSRCIGALWANLALMYHRNIKVLDIYLARLILEFGGATISFTTLALVFITLGWLEPPQDILEIVGGWLIIAWFGSALAIWLGALSHESELVDKLWHPFSYLMFPLSGAAFLVDALPKFAQEAVLWIPIVHGVEIVREGWFGEHARAHYDLGYVLPFCLVLSFVALIQVRKTARRVVPE
ncbi:sugar ABC transporter permease [Novosphingobium sp. PC22D]|uniref:ABC transporter permease n=1 Tax=Novosphingobium sp. PC22D TaxID=1962403 RepID=UPI000BF24996|nr:ABC transporter permease [Novosphingobium sp. PC22D]PEQ13806.1 sugar ABC transporter permease [Novosphingobium sp. PC22D]